MHANSFFQEYQGKVYQCIQKGQVCTFRENVRGLTYINYVDRQGGGWASKITKFQRLDFNDEGERYGSPKNPLSLYVVCALGLGLF